MGYLLAEVQILLLGLDIQNTQTNGPILMTQFWYIILMTSLAYLTLVLPVGLFLSEDDDETKPLVSVIHNFSAKKYSRVSSKKLS